MLHNFRNNAGDEFTFFLDEEGRTCLNVDHQGTLMCAFILSREEFAALTTYLSEMNSYVINNDAKIVSPWRHFKANKENLRAIPTNRDFEVLFDDGTILPYSSELFPFAEIVAWREITD